MARFERSFASLQNLDYRKLWWAGTFSFMSVQMQFLLRGVLAWDLTGREGALGLVYLCFGVALLVATPLGGVAADRLPKRRVLIVSQGAILAAAGGMGVVVLTDVVQYWMLLVAAVTQGVAFGFLGPTRVAFTSEIVGREQLGNAITLSLLSMNGTRVIAPAFAGALAGIVFIGIGGAYVVSAAFSLLSFVLLIRCPPGSAPRATSKASPFAEIVDGVRYVAARPHLRRLVLSSFVIIMFGFNYVAFMPALVKGEFGLGDGWVGIIMSASSIGAVAVGIPLASRADGAGVWKLMVGSGRALRGRRDRARALTGVRRRRAGGRVHRRRDHRLPVVVEFDRTQHDQRHAPGPRPVTDDAQLRRFRHRRRSARSARRGDRPPPGDHLDGCSHARNRPRLRSPRTQGAARDRTGASTRCTARPRAGRSHEW